MLHRIVKKDSALRIEKNRKSEVSPEYLESIINYFLKNNYDIVSLDRIYEILINKKRQKKFVSFTFDDGYIDAYTLAYPVFKKYNLL